MNMRKIFLAAAFSLATLLFNSCLVRINEKAIRNNTLMADGVMVTRTLSLEETVRSYLVLGSGDFSFVQADTDPYLEITASENIMPYLRATVYDGTLTCRFWSDSVGNVHQGKIVVVLHARDLEGVQVTGSGDVRIGRLVREGDFSASIVGSGDVRISGLECENLNLSVAGSGDMDIDVAAKDKISAIVTGSGDVRLAGTADRASFSVAGSGDIDAGGLKVANDISTSVKGRGDIRTR